MSIDTSVAFLQDMATSALSTARTTASRIGSGGTPALRRPSFSYTVGSPNIGPPPQLSDLFPGVDNTAAEIARLNELTDEWVDKYFPAIANCLRTVPEDWLCGVISGTKPFGLDATVFELVWQKARDRAQRQASSELAQVRTELSARGFGLPTGVYVRATTESEQRASDSIANVNIEQAIKDADIKADFIKFAVAEANNLKIGVMNALAQFLRQWADVPKDDIQRAAIRAQAISSLYGALGSYYDVEVAFEQMRMKARELKSDIDLGVDRNSIAAYSSNSAQPALATAVTGFTDVAANTAAGQSAIFAEIGAPT